MGERVFLEKNDIFPKKKYLGKVFLEGKTKSLMIFLGKRGSPKKIQRKKSKKTLGESKNGPEIW